MKTAKKASKKPTKDPRAKVAKRVMNQAIAEKAARAAQAKAADLGMTISVAVVDESGNLVYFVRGDTCTFITFHTCKGKAVMAAGFRRPTNDYAEHIRTNPAVWSTVSEQIGMVAVEGGYPVTRNGVIIGGVGCGGALRGEDHICAEAGAKAVST